MFLWKNIIQLLQSVVREEQLITKNIHVNKNNIYLC